MRQFCVPAFLMGILAFFGIPLVRAVSEQTGQRICTSSRCSSQYIKMTATPKSYNKLSSLCRDISQISEVLGLLTWDEQVMMPSGSSDSRGKQKAALTAIVHEKSTSSDLYAAIEDTKQELDQLDKYQRAVVRDAERSYQLAVGVPPELEREIAQHESECVQKWVAARKDDDFPSFAPSLTHMLKLSRDKAASMRPGQDPYDTMIDTFERGMTAARLKEVFDSIGEPLKDVLMRTLETKQKCTRKVHPALSGGDDWTVDQQELLCKDIVKAIGFDMERGRIGGAGPRDVRITTRYSKEVPFEGIMGTVHEAGHAMYEQGRSNEYDGLPVSQALSMGAHESQSLFWEWMIGLNLGFWKHILPLLHERLPHTREVSAEDFFFAVNQVNPSLIRVDADELTYPFHIIVRFNLERKLVSGELDVIDLPKAWKEGMKQYLNIDVPTDREGCLQDIHWPSGAFGYFPSYSLGAMTAVQLFRHLKKKAMQDVEERIANGDFNVIRDWLRKEIHQVGSLYPSLDELLTKVTGEPLNPSYFIEYLDKKYSAIYANKTD